MKVSKFEALIEIAIQFRKQDFGVTNASQEPRLPKFVFADCESVFALQ